MIATLQAPSPAAPQPSMAAVCMTELLYRYFQWCQEHPPKTEPVRTEEQPK